MDTSEDVYRYENMAPLLPWCANMAPLLPCKLNKLKPEHKSHMKINMQKRLHWIPVNSTSVEILSEILG
jgi:hypothetical protein